MIENNPPTNDCRVMQFRLPLINHTFVGHVIKSVLVKSETGCESFCFANDDCMSVNLGPLEGNKHLCELSSSDHNLHPGDLKPRSGFLYKPVRVSVNYKKKILDQIIMPK